MILTLSGLLVKLFGLFYKIPLVALLGDGGMGYFNSAYTIYTFFYTLSTAGLPVALSILVSGRRANGEFGAAERLLRNGMLAFSLLGLAGSLVLFLFAPFFASFIGNPGAARCIMAVSPVLLLSCMSSVLRGYFQGCKSMTPTAVSSVVEAGGKLVAGLLLALYALHRGYGMEKAAAYAIFGVAVSTAASLLTLGAVKLCRGRGERKKKRERKTALREALPAKRKEGSGRISFFQSLGQILRVAIPATVTSSVMSLTNILDLMTVMRRLQSAGYTAEQANALYGNYTGLAVPMFNLPPVLIAPVAGAIVPYVSACLAKKDRAGAGAYLQKAMRLGLLIGLPASMGLSALSFPTLRLLYPERSAAAAAPLLTVLAPSCLFLGMLTVMSAALQAYGHERLPILAMLAGGGVKIVCSFILIGRIGITGAPVSTLLCYMTACFIDLAFCRRKTGWKADSPLFYLKALFCAGMCTGVALFSEGLAEGAGAGRAAVLPAIACGGAVYLLLLMLTGVLPFGQIKAAAMKFLKKEKKISPEKKRGERMEIT